MAGAHAPAIDNCIRGKGYVDGAILAPKLRSLRSASGIRRRTFRKSSITGSRDPTIKNNP
jgi:hypothetical protein